MDDEVQRNIRDNIRKALSKIRVEFDYTDIYGNEKYFPIHLLSSFDTKQTINIER